MSKHGKRRQDKRCREAKAADSSSVDGRVVSLASPEFCEALAKLNELPTIESFLAALRLTRNPTEIAMLTEMVPQLAATLYPWSEGFDETRKEKAWTDAWDLAELFLRIAPIDTERYYETTVQAVSGTEAMPSDHTPNPAAEAFHEKMVGLFRDLASEPERQRRMAESKGLRTCYEPLFRFDDVCRTAESVLKFDPLRELDAALADFRAARVELPDEWRRTRRDDVRLDFSTEQRAQLAVLWEAACARLLVVSPPDHPDERTSGVPDEERNFAAPLQLWLPWALSGLGCLLLIGVGGASSRDVLAQALGSFGRRYGSDFLSRLDGASDGAASSDDAGLGAEPAAKAESEAEAAIRRILEANSSDAVVPEGERACPEPFESLQPWAISAAAFSPALRVMAGAPSTEAHEILEQAMIHAPILPPMLLEAAMRPAFALNDWWEFDESEHIVRGMINVLLTGDRKRLAGANGYFVETALASAEERWVKSLLAMSRPVSFDCAGFAASRFETRASIPVAWANRGWDGADRRITEAFRSFQERLVVAESRWGCRAVVDEGLLQSAFSLWELPPDCEVVSVRWAIEQVLRYDFLGDPEPLERRARNFGRLVKLLRTRGLTSLAGAFQCFFMVTQSWLVATQALQRERVAATGIDCEPCFVDDWAGFAANTNALVGTGDWRERLDRSARCAASILGPECCGQRFAFEVRQLAELIGDDSEVNDAEVDRSAAEILALAPAPSPFVFIESRLQEAIGDAYSSLPKSVRNDLKAAERQFEIGAGDSDLFGAPASRPWVLSYAKISERLLRQRLGIIWADPVLKSEADLLYESLPPHRRFPRIFEVGAALVVLQALRTKPESPIRVRLERDGVDVAALGGDLGSEYRQHVARVRNAEAHDSANPEDAGKLRRWTFENLPRLYQALGRPPGDSPGQRLQTRDRQ